MFKKLHIVLKLPAKFCSTHLGGGLSSGAASSSTFPPTADSSAVPSQKKLTTTSMAPNSFHDHIAAGNFSDRTLAGNTMFLTAKTKPDTLYTPYTAHKVDLNGEIELDTNVVADPFFEIKSPVDTNKRKAMTGASRKKKLYSVLADSHAEDCLVDFYSGRPAKGESLHDSDALFCLFNPGFSKLPEKFLQRGCRRLLIFDSSKKSCDFWRRFKQNGGACSSGVEFNVEQMEFVHLPNQTLSDLKKGQANSFVEILKKYGCHSQELDADAPSQINFIGVLPFFKEKPFFFELLNTRLQNANLFGFGRVDFLTYVSASKYMVLDKNCPALYSQCKPRRNMYTTFFDVNLVGTVKLPVNGQTDEEETTIKPSFTFNVDLDKALYAKYLAKHGVPTELAYLMHVRPKSDTSIPLHHRPSTDPSVRCRLYKHFECFNRQINLHTKSIDQFLSNLFNGCDEFVTANFFDELNNINFALHEQQTLDVLNFKKFAKRKCKTITLHEQYALFNCLRKWPAYESSAFFAEAENLVEGSSLYVE